MPRTLDLAAHRPGARRDAIHPVDARIGTLIGERRQALGLSRRELGDQLGLTSRQIEMYETGRSRIDASRLAAVAHRLGVEPSWFFDALSPPPPVTSDEQRVAEAFARIDKPAVRASILRLVETMALQSATWTPQTRLPQSDA